MLYTFKTFVSLLSGHASDIPVSGAKLDSFGPDTARVSQVPQYLSRDNNTGQQDLGTRKVYCVSNVTFHAESKYAIKIFPSPTAFVQWPF